MLLLMLVNMLFCFIPFGVVMYAVYATLWLGVEMHFTNRWKAIGILTGVIYSFFFAPLLFLLSIIVTGVLMRSIGDGIGYCLGVSIHIAVICLILKIYYFLLVFSASEFDVMKFRQLHEYSKRSRRHTERHIFEDYIVFPIGLVLTAMVVRLIMLLLIVYAEGKISVPSTPIIRGYYSLLFS